MKPASLIVIGTMLLSCGPAGRVATSHRSPTVTTSAPAVQTPETKVDARARPRTFEALGAGCTPLPRSEMPHGSVAEVQCGRDGLVALVVWRDFADMHPGPGDEIIAERNVEGSAATLSTLLLVTADAVWMQSADQARRRRATTWMALPAHMTDAQRRETQALAGLPTSPVLETGAAWKAALIASGPIPKSPPK